MAEVDVNISNVSINMVEAGTEFEAVRDDQDQDQDQEQEEEQNNGEIENSTVRIPQDLFWCLGCHQRGHRPQICAQAFVAIPEADRWDLLSRAPPIPFVPTYGERSVTGKLINLLSMSVVEIFDFDRHVSRRDTLLIPIYTQMLNWQAPLGHETWYHFMSMFHSVVDHHRNRVLNVLARTLDPSFDAHTLHDETVPEFIPLTVGDGFELDKVEHASKAVNADLIAVQESFQERIRETVGHMEVYLASSTEIRNIDPADSV